MDVLVMIQIIEVLNENRSGLRGFLQDRYENTYGKGAKQKKMLNINALLTEGLHVKEELHENRTSVRKECSTTGLFLVDQLDGNFASV